MSFPVALLVLSGLAWLAWRGRHYDPPPRPRRATEPGPLGQAVGEAVAGVIGLAGASVALLVALAPLLILLWLVTQ